MAKELAGLKVTVNPTRITAIPDYIYTNEKGEQVNRWRTREKADSDRSNLQKKRTTNDISLQARKKVTNRISWMVYATRKKLGTKIYKNGHIAKFRWRTNFVTLTVQSGWHEGSDMFIPGCDPVFFRKVDSLGQQMIFMDVNEATGEIKTVSKYSTRIWIRDHRTDETQHRMMDLDSTLFQRRLVNPFLTYAKKYFGIRNYLWKVERTPNDTLHLHLITDRFIHYGNLRASWNRLLKSNGLLERYAEYSRREHPARSEKQHYNPNSTDIHSTKKNTARYLCNELLGGKYLGLFIKGRLWGCNRALGRIENQKVYLFTADGGDEETRSCLRQLQKTKRQKWIETAPDAEGKTVTIGMSYFPEKREWMNKKLGVIRETFFNALYALRTGGFAEGLLLTEAEKLEVVPVPVAWPAAKVPQYKQSKLNFA